MNVDPSSGSGQTYMGDPKNQHYGKVASKALICDYTFHMHAKSKVFLQFV